MRHDLTASSALAGAAYMSKVSRQEWFVHSSDTRARDLCNRRLGDKRPCLLELHPDVQC